MIKIIMHGCNGKMGRTISNLVAKDAQVEIVAGVDVNMESKFGYPVFPSLKECTVTADVVIDFSIASVIDSLLEAANDKNLPVVLCTTGLSKEQIENVVRTSNHIPILRSANMSLGVNLLLKVLKDLSGALVPEGFDVEIVEKHHNQKVDAPSGTALALADSINEEFGGEMEYVYDRSGYRKKREGKELGISAIRGGTIVGEHEVIFAGTDEVVTISHTAYSKAIFGKGAIVAAKFLAGKEPGLYRMDDVLAE